MLDVSVARGLKIHGGKLLGIIFADLLLCQIIGFADILARKAFLLCGCKRSLKVIFIYFGIMFKMTAS